jgi:hypothetical protein
MNRLEQKRQIKKAIDAPVVTTEAAPVASFNRLSWKQQLAATDWMQDAKHAEIHRICALPLSLGLSDEEHEDFCHQYVLGEPYEAGFRLYRPQANGLVAYQKTGGLLAPIGVGWGKTLLSLMIGQYAYDHEGIKHILLCVPPQVVDQLMCDLRWARTRVRFTVTVLSFYKRSRQKRMQMAQARWPGIYIMPYSLFSSPDASDVLATLRPDLILADEAHNFARRTAARTKRLIHYMDKENEDCRLACMSGTITSKTVMDYYHLGRRALRAHNPLPNDTTQAYDWAQLIDAKAETGQRAGPLLPLCQWAAKNFPDEHIDETRNGFRRAYRLRLNTSPGVVASGDEEIGTSLIFHNEKVDLECDVLKGLMEQVSQHWLTPNGDEIEHAIHTWKWLNELSAGFYNELTWPTADVLAERRGIDVAEATDLLDRAKMHHAAHQDYARQLRDFLEYRAKPGLDTPFLVGGDMNQHGNANVPNSLYAAWSHMKSLEFEGMPERDSRAVRVCDYKLKRAVDYAIHLDDTGSGCIFWVYHQEIGQWLYELCQERMLPALHCPAGENKQIIDPANKDKVVVASLTAHGVGKNLQHFHNQYFVQWPRDPRAAEQTIGRTHRNGQTVDELVVWSNCSSIFDQLNRAACINDALYIHQPTGNRQKLIYGTYDPVPGIFPPEVLREKGLDAKTLTAKQRRMLEDKFGEYQP